MASDSSTEPSSRIPNFFRMSVRERLDALTERGVLSAADARLLLSGDQQLSLPVADKMIENVIGVFGLPQGVALNFLINGRDVVVPLAVEEPSIVAGLSGAARMARLGGGYTFTTTDPILIGQVQLVDMGDPQAARTTLLSHRDELLALANSLHPKMVARGGGARDLDVFLHEAPEDGRTMLVLHLYVDTRDAMGANLVNTMCEGVAPLVETLTGGKVFLRILSNLTDRALVHARVEIPAANLAGKGYSGEAVRDGIVLANDLALVDPYRAATHNKGIMNGVDAVAIATGNDWRALEAAAHAFAARDGRYRALTRWFVGDDGPLVGEIDIPMKVGTVGGSLETNPTVRMNHRLLGNPNASTLAGIMGVVGLAQNFAALRALSTDGIQQNHMTLHARSVASTAKVPASLFDAVVEELIAGGEIKVWKAQEIADRLKQKPRQPAAAERSSASGKAILLGEHAVVYGRPALAVPVPLAMSARATQANAGDGVRVVIPAWGIEQHLRSEQKPSGVGQMLAMLLDTLDLGSANMTIEVEPSVPRAMGLGGSAALAVAIIRALDAAFQLHLDDTRINALAFECERTAHGTPSGIDNTVATFGRPLWYQRAAEARTQPGTGDASFSICEPADGLRLVVGITGKESLTAGMVGQVRAAWEAQTAAIDAIFDQIEHHTLRGREAFEAGDWQQLGSSMNLCHGLLNALQLSTPEIEDLVYRCRAAGALGAKLTGGGGGGSMIALCPGSTEAVIEAIERAGYAALDLG
ncbi:MAG: hydroxymethylglutaryl-CoA reductase, degradative [Pseudomonadota bacterium]